MPVAYELASDTCHGLGVVTLSQITRSHMICVSCLVHSQKYRYWVTCCCTSNDMLQVSQCATHEGYLTQLALNNLPENVCKLRSLMMPANSSASLTINLTVGICQSIGSVHHLLTRKNCNWWSWGRVSEISQYLPDFAVSLMEGRLNELFRRLRSLSLYSLDRSWGSIVRSMLCLGWGAHTRLRRPGSSYHDHRKLVPLSYYELQ